MTSCASKVHRASVSGRGKPVLISILASLLGFHTVNLSNAAVSEKTLHTFQPIPDVEYVVFFVERLMAHEVRCWVADRQTHMTTTITLAAHSC